VDHGYLLKALTEDRYYTLVSADSESLLLMPRI